LCWLAVSPDDRFVFTANFGYSDSWLTPEGAYLYQIYGNASKLVSYATQPDGSLKEIASAEIPYNSPQGLAGF
jgi:6-phosphogluconolactonase (cycloisomerase 2 family)